MSTFIFGDTTQGCDNIIIINGHIISGKSAFGHPQKFDERKSIKADCVGRITVKCDFADIVITACTCGIIDAHFYGEAVTDEKPSLNIKRDGLEVVITLSSSHSIISNGLTLLVSIPIRMLDTLTVFGNSGDVKIQNLISARKMRLDTHNGNIDSTGNFSEMYVSTHNGSAYISVNAKSDIEIEATSHNGNVTVNLQNITTSNISVSSKNGIARNRFRGAKVGYTASGRVYSHNGNIDVQ